MSDKPFDLIVFGATGFTGRQVVRAVARRSVMRPLRWAVAARNEERLREVVGQRVAPAASPPSLVVADAGDDAALDAMAARSRVLVNLAGPYALTGEKVVQACIANGTHYLDLSGETFWIRQLVERHHRAAQSAGVKVIPCCGYEALPFDLATLWAAQQLRERAGESCRDLKLVVRFTGPSPRRWREAIGDGTLASLRSLLELDTSDSVRNPACLLPQGAADAELVAERNAYAWTPRYDRDVHAVTAPTLPVPFVTPPVVLRSVALAADPTLFSPEFRYRESTDMSGIVPRPMWMPARATLPLQWAAAGAIAAPLAGLAGSIAGPLAFQRGALTRLIDLFGAEPGEEPSEDALARSGYVFDLFARSAGNFRFRGRVTAQGHPGHRSTPEMLATVAVGLAHGDLGRTSHFGIVTPATGLGIEAAAALREAGLTFTALG